jgi:hypothetical protein
MGRDGSRPAGRVCSFSGLFFVEMEAVVYKLLTDLVLLINTTASAILEVANRRRMFCVSDARGQNFMYREPKPFTA